MLLRLHLGGAACRRQPPRCECTDGMLSCLDVLVEGRFVEAEKDISLRFRGSRNQRILDVPRSLRSGAPVFWEEEA